MRAADVFQTMAELFHIYENGKGINRVFDIDAAGEAFDGNKLVNTFYWSSSWCVSGDRETDTLDFLNSRLYRTKPDCLSAADRELHGASEKKSADGSAESQTFTGYKNGSDNLDQVEVFEGSDDTATEENYPAFCFCKNYSSTAVNLSGADYESGWSLPEQLVVPQKAWLSVSCRHGITRIRKKNLQLRKPG